MQLFEITLVLLAIAVVLLQVARHMRVPYPAMLALAGGCVAALPFVPHLSIEPRLALALFVAPAVMDTAFDMPPREMLRIWLPLTSLAVVLVLLTTAAVAWAGWAIAGLPLAAAVALGAIVAPPDAAAAAAVLQEFNLPRRTVAVLQGESLLNDAVALLVFGLAVSAAVSPGSAWNALLPRLGLAVPGGALLGVATGVLSIRVSPQGGRYLVVHHRSVPGDLRYLDIGRTIVIVAHHGGGCIGSRGGALHAGADQRTRSRQFLRGLGFRRFRAQCAGVPADGLTGAHHPEPTAGR